ncbi:MAG TPA: transposase [Rhodoglobus sp.]|nr:transposase [Rhodoglobus sp.]
MSLNPITRKQKWSETEGRQVVDEWRRSGLSPADFARQHGLAEVRLLRWRARIEEQVAQVAQVDPVTAAFLPVKIKESAEQDMGEGVALVLKSGVVIRVPVGTSPTWVARLVQALEHAPC